MERITPVSCNVIREKYGLEKDSYILYVGRISPEKGPQDLLEAYQKLRLQERLVLAGPIPETEFGKEMLHKIDADPRVIRTGLVQGQELAELFSNCRLFVLPRDFPLPFWRQCPVAEDVWSVIFRQIR